ncbi:MAG: filamentous hemagglutinin N-terminal domain-containing protein, partial [Alphaproteobacteria bacterium]
MARVKPMRFAPPTALARFKQLLATVCSAALVAAPMRVYANPQDGTVVSGNASIVQESPATLVILQSTDKAVIDWRGFSIGEGETTRFEQPNGSSVTLNRVTGSQVSEILGNLQANGRVFVVNPNGVVFGQNSRVDVGGLVASTANISNHNFEAGNFTFDQAGVAGSQVFNAGTITAADGGLVALVAPIVKNTGTITARLGKVQLAGGQTFTLDLYGDQLVALAVDDNTLAQSLAENSGAIAAAGGRVAVTAGQAQHALNNVVNMNGVIAADTVGTQDGRIVLGSSQGLTTVAGTATANAIEVGGGRIAVRSGATLNADGDNGGGTVHVGGKAHGEVLDTFGTTAERVLVERGATLSANATENGNGGEVTVWADNTTGYAGHASAQGGAGGGDGGFIEVSGKENLIFNGTANTSAARGAMGELLLDPIDITIVDGAGGADDGQVSDGIILQGDTPMGSFTISENTLEALSSGTNISLLATNNFTIDNLTDNVLDLLTTGSVVFRADADLDGNGVFTMHINDTIRTDGADVTLTGETVQVGGVDTSGGSFGDITFTGNSGVSLNNSYLTDGGDLYVNGPVTLDAPSVFIAGGAGGDLNFTDDVVGDNTFAITAGTGHSLNFQSIDIDTLTLNSAGSMILNGMMRTDQALNFSALDGGIDLQGNSSIIAHDGVTAANVTMGAANSINGGYTLDVTGAAVTLRNLGNVTPLTSLAVTGNTITVNSGVTTTGAQTYAGDVTLNTNLTTSSNNIAVTGNVNIGTNVTISSGAGAGNLSITGNLNGAHEAVFTAGTGTITIGGAVGGTTPLTALTANGSNISVLGGVNTTGAQTYNAPVTAGGAFTAAGNDMTFAGGAVTLAANTTMASSGGDITFASTIDGAYNLALNAGAGIIDITGAVGGITPLGTLALTGSALTLQDGAFSTGTHTYTGALTLDGNLTASAGALSFSNAVTLNGNSIWTTGGGSSDNIAVAGAVAGDFTLALVAGLGDISFLTLDVDTLTLTSADDLTLTGAFITTDTAQDYSNIDDITLNTDTTLTAQNGATLQNITFDSGNTIMAAGDLTLTG